MKLPFATFLVVALLSACSKEVQSPHSIFNDKMIEKEFLATAQEFLTPPTALVGDDYFRFCGFEVGTPEARLAEWKSLQKLTLDGIVANAAKESCETLNRDLLQRSAVLAGITETNRIEEIVTTNNILSLQRLIATHEMKRRMATQTALLLSFRQLKEK